MKLLASLSLALLISLSIVPTAEAKKEWVCKPGWGNWRKEVIHHKSYTTTSFMYINKSMIPMTHYHPAWDENKWHCKNWIKAHEVHKYNKDGKLLKP